MGKKVVIWSSVALFFTYILLKLAGILMAGFFVRTLFALLLVILMIFGAIIVLLALVIGVTTWRRERASALIPLGVSLVTCWLIVFQPLAPLFLQVEFRLDEREREDVLFQYQNNLLNRTEQNDNLYVLPAEYSYLSDGGEVLKVGKNKVLFFDVRGLVDNFSGYVYSADGSEPTDDEIGAKIMYIKKLSKRWYYISCT